MSLSLVGALAAAAFAVALGIALALGDSPRLPRLSHPDAGDLADAGWGAGLGRWEALRGLVIAVAIAGAVAGLPFLVVPVVSIAPSVWVRLRAEAARAHARRGMRQVVAATEASLRSGIPLPESLRRAADQVADPLAVRRIRRALREFDLGAGLDAALIGAARDSRDARARMALGTLALGVAERLPRDRVADLLGVVGDRLAFEDQLDDEVRARAAGARQQQWLLALLVPVMALYLAATMPTLALTLDSALGRFVLIPAAATLEVAGMVISRRIVGGVLR